jgi:prepilin-type N-terminal cleavage/methylation domain-containing protein
MSQAAAQRVSFAEMTMDDRPQYISDINDLILYSKNDELPICPTGGQYAMDAKGIYPRIHEDDQRSMKWKKSLILRQNRRIPFMGSRSGMQNGFTWIELIVVIVIIGILLAIAYAKYADMSESTRTSKCISNQMSLETAQRLHYATTALTGSAEYATDLDDLILFLRDGAVPSCPSNGKYVIKANGDVTCTEPDHQR